MSQCLRLIEYEDNIRKDTRLDFATLHFYKSALSLQLTHDFFSNMTNAGLRGEFLSWVLDMTTEIDFVNKVMTECHNVLSDSELISALKAANFDLTLTESSEECPITPYLGIPYVVVHPMLVTPLTGSVWRYIANRVPVYPSYMPEHLTEYDHKMTFNQRMVNLAYHVLYFLIGLFNPYSFRTISNMYNISQMHDDFATAELWLMNTHFALDFPRPLLPNTIPVGGLSTKPAKPLSRVSSYLLCVTPGIFYIDEEFTVPHKLVYRSYSLVPRLVAVS